MDSYLVQNMVELGLGVGLGAFGWWRWGGCGGVGWVVKQKLQISALTKHYFEENNVISAEIPTGRMDDLQFDWLKFYWSYVNLMCNSVVCLL